MLAKSQKSARDNNVAVAVNQQHLSHPHALPFFSPAFPSQFRVFRVFRFSDVLWPLRFSDAAGLLRCRQRSPGATRGVPGHWPCSNFLQVPPRAVQSTNPSTSNASPPPTSPPISQPPSSCRPRRRVYRIRRISAPGSCDVRSRVAFISTEKNKGKRKLKVEKTSGPIATRRGVRRR